MTRLSVLSAKKLIKILESVGFRVMRQRGSHAILKHADGRVTVIPIHRGEDLGRGLLRKILRDVKMEPEDLLKLL